MLFEVAVRPFCLRNQGGGGDRSWTRSKSESGNDSSCGAREASYRSAVNPTAGGWSHRHPRQTSPMQTRRPRSDNGRTSSKLRRGIMNSHFCWGKIGDRLKWIVAGLRSKSIASFDQRQDRSALSRFLVTDAKNPRPGGTGLALRLVPRSGYAAFFRTRHVLFPPKPNEFETVTSISVGSGSFRTCFNMAHSGSGSSRFTVGGAT
jgi:hypothetical protein